jgi:leucyl/phenylalanyl-tRNA--protein transferase
VAVVNFPPVETADENGLLALGGDLEIPTLILAYRQGIFPWPINEDFPLAWFSPDPRGIIAFKDLKVNKRLSRYFKKSDLTFKANTNFKDVIENCAQAKRRDQAGTWITQEVLDGYIHLFNKELAYSIEAYENDKLVGGVYGVCINGIITGESMFHSVDNASKFCLVLLLNLLNEAGIDWLDTQMVTPVIKALGGSEIPRRDFIRKLGRNPLKMRSEIFPQEITKEHWPSLL